MSETDWTVAYYVEDGDGVPLPEFRAGLDRKTNARFDWTIEQLRLRNVQAREPLVRRLEGRLWEVREESATNIYRMLYSFVSDRTIVLLHGFREKIQKTPRRENETAQRRLDRFLEREGR